MFLVIARIVLLDHRLILWLCLEIFNIYLAATVKGREVERRHLLWLFVNFRRLSQYTRVSVAYIGWLSTEERMNVFSFALTVFLDSAKPFIEYFLQTIGLFPAWVFGWLIYSSYRHWAVISKHFVVICLVTTLPFDWSYWQGCWKMSFFYFFLTARLLQLRNGTFILIYYWIEYTALWCALLQLLIMSDLFAAFRFAILQKGRRSINLCVKWSRLTHHCFLSFCCGSCLLQTTDNNSARRTGVTCRACLIHCLPCHQDVLLGK